MKGKESLGPPQGRADDFLAAHATACWGLWPRNPNERSGGCSPAIGSAFRPLQRWCQRVLASSRQESVLIAATSCSFRRWRRAASSDRATRCSKECCGLVPFLPSDGRRPHSTTIGPAPRPGPTGWHSFRATAAGRDGSSRSSGWPERQSHPMVCGSRSAARTGQWRSAGCQCPILRSGRGSSPKGRSGR